MDSLWLRHQCSECLAIDGRVWAQHHLYRIMIYDAKATFNSSPYIKRKVEETSKFFCHVAQKQMFSLPFWHYGLLFQTMTQVRCTEIMYQCWLRYTKVTEGTCVRAVQVPTLITFAHTFFFYHDKSNSNKYSLQTVNRKLFQSRVSEQKLTLLWERLWNLLPWFRMFCTLSKALNPKIIKSFYFRQAVLIPLNYGQELNDLKILSNLCFWFHFQHNDERKPTTSVWYLQRVTVQYVFGSVCCV